MLQPVRCLPHKHEGLSWIPNTHLKEMSSTMHTVTPAIVEPWVCWWPAWVQEEILSLQGRAGIEGDTQCRSLASIWTHIHVCPYADTHTKWTGKVEFRADTHYIISPQQSAGNEHFLLKTKLKAFLMSETTKAQTATPGCWGQGRLLERSWCLTMCK